MLLFILANSITVSLIHLVSSVLFLVIQLPRKGVTDHPSSHQVSKSKDVIFHEIEYFFVAPQPQGKCNWLSELSKFGKLDLDFPLLNCLYILMQLKELIVCLE